MRQRLASAPWFVLVLVWGLFLVACERPLQDEAELTVEPTAPDEETLPAYPGLETPAAPGLLSTPTSSAPGAETGEEEQTPAEEGGEATAAPPEGEAEPAGDVIHTVVAGDTLGDLANQYGVSVEAIAAANDLPDVHTLEVGQQLLIPLSGETGVAEEEEEPVEEVESEVEGEEQESPPAVERVHTVQPGDTLFRIGQQYGFTVDELVAFNNLTNPDRLDVGDQIRIPPDGYTIEP